MLFAATADIVGALPFEAPDQPAVVSAGLTIPSEPGLLDKQSNAERQLVSILGGSGGGVASCGLFVRCLGREAS